MTDAARILIAVLIALWALAFGYAFFPVNSNASTTNQSTDVYASISAGMAQQRLHFFGWQAIAGLFSLAAWGVGLRFRRGDGVRKVAVAPILLTLLAILAFVVLRHGLEAWV
jgi:hypothetical protein